MQEWSPQSRFNSFNSWKGLLYADWYKGVVAGKFLPPVEASIDPIHACNLRCRHCNAGRFMTGEVMPPDHLINLVKFLGKWGVKATCFAGGGEPLLHPSIRDAVRATRTAGMEASIITNGTLLNRDLLDIVPLCRWIGVSVDAATAQTYSALKGADLFRDVIGNIIRAAANHGDCDIGFKFLVSSVNQHEILAAAKLARDIGVHDFHVRPMDFHHQGMAEKDQLSNINIPLITDQMAACRELETDDFRVFTVVHKFNPDFTPRKDFTQCYGAALVIQLCADGNAYLCVDQRHVPEMRIGAHYPDPENILSFWGGDRHVAMVTKDSLPATCTTRCTFGVYCEQCEQLFASNTDPMCWRFP